MIGVSLNAVEVCRRAIHILVPTAVQGGSEIFYSMYLVRPGTSTTDRKNGAGGNIIINCFVLRDSRGMLGLLSEFPSERAFHAFSSVRTAPMVWGSTAWTRFGITFAVVKLLREP